MSTPLRAEERASLPTGATMRGALHVTNTAIAVVPSAGKVICGFRSLGSKNIVITKNTTTPNGQPFTANWLHSQSVSTNDIPLGDSNGVQVPLLYLGRWTQITMKSSGSTRGLVEIYECDV